MGVVGRCNIGGHEPPSTPSKEGLRSDLSCDHLIVCEFVVSQGHSALTVKYFSALDETFCFSCSVPPSSQGESVSMFKSKEWCSYDISCKVMNFIQDGL